MFAAAGEVLNTFLAAGAILGGIAYALGQWVSARKRGSSDALRIAVEEVEAVKIRADRFEKEIVALQAEMHELRKENELLRSLVTHRGESEEKLLAAIDTGFQRQTRRLVDVFREERQG